MIKKKKKYYANISELGNWKDNLEKSCDRWFVEGATCLVLGVLSYEIIKDKGEEVRNKIDSKIKGRTFATDGFIQLIKKLFGESKFSVYSYAYTKEYEYAADLENDDYVFICTESTYFLHFGMND